MHNIQSALAEAFRVLHFDDGPLVLLNAWDAASACLMEHVGCKAIATTSGGVAWSHGYQDGGSLPIEILTRTVESIRRVVSVPLSVDIENGYSDDPKAVEETISAVIAAGAVGINIEDGTKNPDVLCRKIEAGRRASEQSGVQLFINARTDVFLRGLVAEDQMIAEVIRRSDQYRGAGADGVFVPLISDTNSIQAVVDAVQLPVNVMACPGLPSTSELKQLGVRRLSAGTGISQAVYGHAKSIAEAFLHDGKSESVAVGGMSFHDVNSLFP